MKTILRYIPFLACTILACTGGYALANPGLRSNIYLQAQNSQQIDTLVPPQRSEIVVELGLTDEQILRLAEISRETASELDPLYAEWDEAQQDLENLMVNAEADETQIREKFAEVESLRQQVFELELERQLAVRNILRPQQYEPYERYVQSLIDN